MYVLSPEISQFLPLTSFHFDVCVCVRARTYLASSTNQSATNWNAFYLFWRVKKVEQFFNMMVISTKKESPVNIHSCWAHKTGFRGISTDKKPISIQSSHWNRKNSFAKQQTNHIVRLIFVLARVKTRFWILSQHLLLVIFIYENQPKNASKILMTWTCIHSKISAIGILLKCVVWVWVFQFEKYYTNQQSYGVLTVEPCGQCAQCLMNNIQRWPNKTPLISLYRVRNVSPSLSSFR